MFQSIDDVQLVQHDPLYDDGDTEVATSARERDGLSGAALAQAHIQQSLHSGSNMPSLKATGAFPGLGGAKSMANLTTANQLLLKVPKVPTDGAIRAAHPVNNWVKDVGDQLSSFKKTQTKTFLPQVSLSAALRKDKKVLGTQSMVHIRPASNMVGGEEAGEASGNPVQDEIMRNKQFSTLNCQPYHRDGVTDFGICKFEFKLATQGVMSHLVFVLLAKARFNLPPTKSQANFSKPVTSVTGMTLMTPLGPGSHMHKIRNLKPHQSGSIIGDHTMPYHASEA